MIACLICGDLCKSISPHLKKHSMRLAEYREKFTDSEGNVPPVGWTVQHSTKPTKRPGTPSPEVVVVAPLKVQPTDFHARYKVLFMQAEEDPALEPSIREIVKNEEAIARYQKMISEYSDIDLKDIGNLEIIATLAKLVKEAQKSNLDAMSALSLTRKAKKESKQSVQTTPSRLVSALENFLKTSNSEVIRRMNEDMLESAARLRRNFDSLSKEYVTEIGKTDGESTEDLVPETL